MGNIYNEKKKVVLPLIDGDFQTKTKKKPFFSIKNTFLASFPKTSREKIERIMENASGSNKDA